MTATKKLIIASIAAALLPTMALAADSTSNYPTNYGYLVDSNGKVVKDNYGECWHTGYWTPAMANEECDPNLVKKAEVATPVEEAAPQAAPEPVAAMPRHVSLSADALFAFNKSTLKPTGKTTLDDLVRDLNATKFDEIQVTGHTDRIGSASYNQKLSVRRADSVKDYLVSKGIPADKISAKGVGKSQPVTKPGECVGRKSPKLIACLQPDRRVEVEVTATKEPAAN